MKAWSEAADQPQPMQTFFADSLDQARHQRQDLALGRAWWLLQHRPLSASSYNSRHAWGRRPLATGATPRPLPVRAFFTTNCVGHGPEHVATMERNVRASMKVSCRSTPAR